MEEQATIPEMGLHFSKAFDSLIRNLLLKKVDIYELGNFWSLFKIAGFES